MKSFSFKGIHNNQRFLVAFMPKGKKCISPVVATALLLVTAVVGVIGFQTWFGSFSSGVLAGVEESSSQSSGVVIDGLVGNSVYVRNLGMSNLSNVTIKIGGVVCNLSRTLVSGMNEINVSACLANVTETKPEVVLVTSEGVLSKTFVVSSVEIGSVLAESDLNWVQKIGFTGSDYVYGMFVDSSKNLYAVGSYSLGPIDLGNGVVLPVTGNSDSDPFLVKFSSNGTALWAKTIPSTTFDSGNRVAVDSSGNVIITGYYQAASSQDLGNGVILPATNSSSRDGFIVKYDSSGLPLWAKFIGTSNSNDATKGVVVDDSGNIYVSGSYTSSPISFGSGFSLPAPLGTSGNYLLKLDSSGSSVWVKNINFSTSGSFVELYYYNSGIYGVGTYTSSLVDLGSGVTIPASASNDAFVAKYDLSGNPVWARNIGGTSGDSGNKISVSSYGVLVGGQYLAGPIDLGNGVILPMVSNGNNDAFLVKFDLSGVAQWGKYINGTYGDQGYGVGFDSSGNVYFCGAYSLNSSDLGNGVVIPSYSGPSTYYDPFMMKYNSAGVPQWVRVINAVSNYDSCYDLKVDVSDNVYFAGTYSLGPHSIGNLTLPAAVALDSFIFRYK